MIQTNQLRDNEKLIEGMNFKILKSINTEGKLDDALTLNDKLKTEIDQKEHEIQMTLADYKNIQEALDELKDASKVPQSEEKPIPRKVDTELKKKYEEAKEELESALPKIEMVNKYKTQIEELCKANIDLKSKYKVMEKDISK